MKRAFIKKITHTLVCSSLLIGTAVYADSLCSTGYPTPVSGKIINNGQAGGVFSTLGVVSLKVGDKSNVIAKMKCGIVGIGADSEPGVIAFTHTLSCDDQIPFLGETLHSQITLDTSGYFFNPQNCEYAPGRSSVSFVETSTPQVIGGMSTGRGLFSGVTEGEISIEGDVGCFGSIDMEFEGYVCLVPPQ